MPFVFKKLKDCKANKLSKPFEALDIVIMKHFCVVLVLCGAKCFNSRFDGAAGAAEVQQVLLAATLCRDDMVDIRGKEPVTHGAGTAGQWKIHPALTH